MVKIYLTHQVKQPYSNSHDAFETMCEALCFAGGDFVAVLTAYFDESYNQLDSSAKDVPIYSVGCWLSTADRWKKFGTRWEGILEDAEIEHFHMSKYESGFPPYDTWSGAKRLDVIQKLLRAISDYRLFGCVPTVHQGDWTKFIEKRPYLKNAFGRTAYGFDVLACIGMINDWCDKHDYDGPIHYVFARLQGQGNALDHIFKTLLKDKATKQKYRLTGMWSHGYAKEVSQLQAADIVAYEFMKRAANEYGRGKKFIRGALEYLGDLGLDIASFDPIYFDRNALRVWGNDVVASQVPLAIQSPSFDKAIEIPDFMRAYNGGLN